MVYGLEVSSCNPLTSDSSDFFIDKRLVLQGIQPKPIYNDLYINFISALKLIVFQMQGIVNLAFT